MRDLDWAKNISLHGDVAAVEPAWVNGWFPPIDGLSLAAILRDANPAIFLEIGSGNSTKFARRTIKEHGLRTRVISIDPHPRAEIDALCDIVIRSSLEDADLSVLSELTSGDVVFIDSSHRSFMNSDVSVFFIEVLPSLPPNVIYGLHDIFLPNDYADEWSDRFYNEQYLLASYLLGGADGDSIVFPARFASLTQPFRAELSSLGTTMGLPTFTDDGAGGFWMQRCGAR